MQLFQRIAASAFLLGLLAVTQAQTAPQFDFKGLRPGLSLEQVHQLGLTACSKRKTAFADSICHHPLGRTDTVAGAPAAWVFASMIDDSVSSISVGFAPRDWEQVSQAFIVKYGTPTDRRTETLKTRGGLEVENLLLTWRAPAGTMVLEKYSSSIDRSTLRIDAPQAAEQFKQRRKDAADKNSKDL